MKIAMVGTGYVGLVTGTCFAESGNEVVCIDKDEAKVATLEEGKLPIYEPGLLELVQRNRREGRLTFTTGLADGIRDARCVFVAVGTPQAHDGSADLSALWAVADAIARHVTGPKIVVVKSTVPVGTNRVLAERLAKATSQPIDVASNPEFLKEGAAVEDCMKPDRVVVGVRRQEVANVLRELYAPFLRTERPFLVMSPESAEMTKYAANAMLATKISFINEMANLCEAVGADVNDVRRGIGTDDRIGFQFLFPGAGYGGSCFEGDETIFVADRGGLRATALRSVFDNSPEPIETGEVEVLRPRNLRVLAFDLETGKPRLAAVQALTRRRYEGVMVEVATSMGRRVRVTADHPMILQTAGGFEVIPAARVNPGDRLPALCELPARACKPDLRLIDLLRGTELEASVHVRPTDDSFTHQYSQFASYIPRKVLKHPVEIRDHNRMPLRLFRALRSRGVLHVPDGKLQLYTAKGAATFLDAVIPIDGDLLRLCGYYLAEGYLSKDKGRAGAVRERVGFCFNENEDEYIEDVRRILSRYGLKFGERRGPGCRATVVSSRVFAWLLRDVLGCGTCCENKALPPLAFNVPPALRRELIRGAFSGDGAVTRLQNGRNLMLEYATVSKRLANGLALLLQSVGVVPSLRPRWMNKSKQAAFLMRVSGYSQLRSMQEAFGGKHYERITSVLDGYERHIRQRGFDRHGPYATLAVTRADWEQAETTVYSLETETGTVVVGSGLVVHNCFPKDIRAIISMSLQSGVNPRMMASVDEINEAQKRVLFAKVRAYYGESLPDKTLAVWGLAFKPRTDDIREAPSLVLIDALLAEGVKVRVHDPEAMPNVRALYGDRLTYCDRPYGALEGADGLAIVTEWKHFHNPDFEVMRRLLSHPVIFDGRNLYDPATVRGLGFTYFGMGR